MANRSVEQAVAWSEAGCLFRDHPSRNEEVLSLKLSPCCLPVLYLCLNCQLFCPNQSCHMQKHQSKTEPHQSQVFSRVTMTHALIHSTQKVWLSLIRRCVTHIRWTVWLILIKKKSKVRLCLKQVIFKVYDVITQFKHYDSTVWKLASRLLPLQKNVIHYDIKCCYEAPPAVWNSQVSFLHSSS